MQPQQHGRYDLYKSTLNRQLRLIQKLAQHSIVVKSNPTPLVPPKYQRFQLICTHVCKGASAFTHTHTQTQHIDRPIGLPRQLSMRARAPQQHEHHHHHQHIIIITSTVVSTRMRTCVHFWSIVVSAGLAGAAFGSTFASSVRPNEDTHTHTHTRSTYDVYTWLNCCAGMHMCWQCVMCIYVFNSIIYRCITDNA